MQLTVKQDKGKDSTITVTEDVIKSWPEDKQILIFETDQSLASQSDRAYNVWKAIEDYANPLGYQHSKDYDEKHKAVFVYSAHYHSLRGEFEIRTKVKEDSRYQEAAQLAKEKQDTINNEYGIAIRQLKNLVFELERKNNKELESVKQDLIDVQVSLVQEISIPDYIQEDERKRLLEPHYPYTEIKSDNYYNHHGQRDVMPESLDWILDLL